MCKEVCRHPGSENNFFRRLEQDQQAKEVIRIVRTETDLRRLDEISLKTQILMPPRRKPDAIFYLGPSPFRI